MNNNKLTLNMHFIPGNKGCLVFKKIGLSFRISRLTNALGFIADMKQLQKAMACSDKQDGLYALNNDTGRQWLLYTGLRNGRVTLLVGTGQTEPVFGWQGSLEEFRNAIESMLETMGRYAFFE